jgi:hypothetical protein
MHRETRPSLLLRRHQQASIDAGPPVDDAAEQPVLNERENREMVAPSILTRVGRRSPPELAM